jgi:CHAT domain-containing protein/Tfp pilus assembly protein PilF
LASLLGIAAFGLWRHRASRPGAVPLPKEVKPVSTEVHFRDGVRKLQPEQPVETELKGGEGDRYEADLQAGQYVHLVADQRGIDVTVRLRGPDGAVVLEVDSPTPTGNTGLEQIFVIPEVSGTFRTEVFSTDRSAAAGRYEIKLQTLRTPTEADRKHVQAFKLLMEGEKLRRQGAAAAQSSEKYEAALALWRGGSESEWVAESLYLIGWVNKDDPKGMAKALSAFREALPLLHASGKRDEEGVVLTWRGNLELRNGAVEDAIGLQLQAINIFQEIKNPDLEASALNSLGAAYGVGGQTQRALDSFRLALAQTRDGNLAEEASALRGIGWMLIEQGKFEAAMDSLRQALAAFQKLGSSSDAADTSSRMAEISQRLGRLDDARSQLQTSLDLQQRAGDEDGQVMTLNSLGTVHLLQKETSKAGDFYGKALRLAQSTNRRHDQAISLLNLGRYRFEAGDPQEALRLHEQAATLFQALGYRRGEVSTLYGSARALHRLGDYQAARERLERVVEGVEALREESENQDLRSAYFATKQPYFELHIDVLMHLHALNPKAGYNAQALVLNERSRAKSLLETLAEPRPKIGNADPEVLAREREIRQKLNVSVAQLAIDNGKHTAASLAHLEERQRALLLELADIDAQLRSRKPGLAALAKPQSLTVSDMQKLAGKWGLLLVYSLGEERSFLWCLAGDGQIASYDTLPSRAWLEEAAAQVRMAWSRKGGERSTAARWAVRLSQEILGPVAKRLGKKRLLIVADGALETVPFAALPDPRALSGNPEQDEEAEPLVVQNEVVHLPSIGTLAVLRNKPRLAPPPSKLAVVADPVFSADDPRVKGGASIVASSRGTSDSNLARAAQDLGIQGFERLPYTRLEAETIAKLVPHSSRVVLDFEASRQFVEQPEIKRYQILHFATHGLLNSRHPELSGIVLSQVDAQGNARDDGFLLAHEISSLDLRAQLVVLSACQTGLGDEVRGEGLVSLTRSFMSAGVPQVIVSLWNVNDQATSELMTRFYRGMIAKGLPPAAALRCAQLSMRRQKEWSSPYFWAPFIFQGDWMTQNPSDHSNEQEVMWSPSDDSIEKQVVKSPPPPVSDTDFPPPGSDGEPPCPDLP